MALDEVDTVLNEVETDDPASRGGEGLRNDPIGRGNRNPIARRLRLDGANPRTGSVPVAPPRLRRCRRSRTASNHRTVHRRSGGAFYPYGSGLSNAMTRTPIVPPTARIGRTALRVANLDAAIDFYRDVVGLTVRTRTETAATLGAGGTPFLVLTAADDAPSRNREETGLFHNAFRVPSRAALGAALDRIDDRWQLDGASDHFVSEALYLTDPEDNGVEIYRDRPREEWPRTDDGTVRIGTVPLDVDDLAAESNGSGDVPPGTAVGHVHLEVSSIEASRSFYVETLGLRVQTEMRSALFLAAGDYHHHLGVNTWNGRTRPVGGRGLAWFELLLSDEEAFATVRRRLTDAGVPVAELDGGIEITDPDGIAVRFGIE